MRQFGGAVNNQSLQAKETKYGLVVAAAVAQSSRAQQFDAATMVSSFQLLFEKMETVMLAGQASNLFRQAVCNYIMQEQEHIKNNVIFGLNLEGWVKYTPEAMSPLNLSFLSSSMGKP